MKRWTVGLGVLAVWGRTVGRAEAVAASFTQLPLDSLVVQISNSLVNTWIPFFCLIGLISVAVGLMIGRIHWGERVAKYCAGMAILAVGLPGISAIFGGQIATSMLWP